MSFVVSATPSSKSAKRRARREKAASKAFKSSQEHVLQAIRVEPNSDSPSTKAALTFPSSADLWSSAGDSWAHAAKVTSASVAAALAGVPALVRMVSNGSQPEEDAPPSTPVPPLTEQKGDAVVAEKGDTAESKGDSKGDPEKVYQEAMKPLAFDEVEKFESHSLDTASSETLSKEWSKRVGSEYKEISEFLPLSRGASIFVRICDGKMQAAKFLVTGPAGTPYAHGCFLFDIYFPPQYPSVPPKVQLQTTGGGTVTFNPNLYNSGYVCLSLLGTWSGDDSSQGWQPSTSTFLQVMVSIQSLVMGVKHPYYNEPGHGGHGENGNDVNEQAEHSPEVISYTRTVEDGTARYAILDMLKNPPKEFEKAVRKHFFLQKDAVIAQVKVRQFAGFV